jgi:hypothetical protein
MPGFSNALDDDQRWAVIDYIRGHNAGVAVRGTGAWPHPVQAPEIQARCEGHDVTLADLRGHFVRLVIGDVPRNAVAAGVVTIVASDKIPVPTGVCTAIAPGVPAAYAIVSGSREAEVAGMEFLIDDQGWLRALQRPRGGAGWDDTGLLDAEIRTLRTQPVTAPSDATAAMPMNMKM